ncbi:aspartyl-phosphate phosphatase Spo0E family protein [Marinococcus halotolerans]|uniref:aspartyl-phosphate phosphatase Spo0E family protein n=1 Tax=Marinococcus halotolerans TaxID=301092 RepID=UPI000A05BDB4
MGNNVNTNKIGGEERLSQQYLRQEIEQTRDRLHQLTSDHTASLISDDVLALSKELDVLLNKYELISRRTLMHSS